jgi:hypothetical protein
MVKPKPQQDEKGRFVPGNNGGSGRPKGSRNQLGEAFIADFYVDWQAHGVATIEAVRERSPVDYLKVVASILPKDLNMKVSAVESMTDEELDAAIARLLAERGDGAEGEGPPSTEQ